jgi:hypothetical protein
MIICIEVTLFQGDMCMTEKFQIKIIATIIIFIMGCNAFIVTANTNYERKENPPIDNDFQTIRIALFTDEKESDESFYGPYGRTRYFMWALSDFSWKVGKKTYCFDVTLLPTERLLRGELSKDNYEVLLYPPDTANEKLFYNGFSKLPKNILRKKIINKFIEDGGGYFATCGAAAISGKFANKPKTFIEHMLKNSCLEISGTEIEIHTAAPIFGQMGGFGPQSVGSLGYLMYSSWNQTNYSINYHSGICLDVTVCNDHPIFDDYLEGKRKIRWIGLEPLEIPEYPDREITALARFPSQEISDNKTTQIHHWEYTGRISGFIKALFRRGGDIHYWENLGVFMKIFVFAGDWEPDILLETNFSNKPFMTAETYPNHNKARLVLCSGHPEHNVWWGGHLEEIEDTDDNNIYEGFYHWKNVTPEEETVEDEFAYNYWIIRRCIAWASNMVPDNDLPSVYGSSEIRDIRPYSQPTTFNIIGNVDTSDGIELIEVYYQYSDDNVSWGKWNYYGTDLDGSDGWIVEFDTSRVNGSGYYRFYSIRSVEFENHWEIERVPPGPDAVVYVSEE